MDKGGGKGTWSTKADCLPYSCSNWRKDTNSRRRVNEKYLPSARKKKDQGKTPARKSLQLTRKAPRELNAITFSCLWGGGILVERKEKGIRGLQESL